ncbi:coiled-coil domain-containing protein [Halopseudomonas salina]|uniref:ATPase n=1 Tax=Halopseudomonas salina TaxID=1323744 RepID=A0ABQ1PJX2_9GAMM|nr:hypothetical protein [Halopseudomonas salina]GGC98559.1 ATPase [Halopseudomonas salina]
MKQRNPDEGLTSFRATDDADPLDARAVENIRTPVRMESRDSGTGALWALCGALTLSLVGFGYWSHQQQTKLQQQLVATQNSFARISEEAAGRIQDVTGKLSATESSRTVAEQSREERLTGMQRQLTELAERIVAQDRLIQAANATDDELAGRLETQRENQQTLTTQTGELAELVAAQADRITTAEAQAAGNATQLEGIANQIAGLNDSLAQLQELEGELASQSRTTAALAQRLEALAEEGAGANIEQELLVLRTEMEERQNYNQEALQSIDAFRRQINRTIVTLKEQIANLQQQLARS